MLLRIIIQQLLRVQVLIELDTCRACAWYKLVVPIHIEMCRTCLENDLADCCCKCLFTKNGMRVTYMYVMWPHCICTSSFLASSVIL